MLLKRVLPLMLVTTALLLSRNMLGLNINTEDFEIEGSADINAFSEYTNGTIFMVDANYLNTENDDLFGIGLSAHNSFQGQGAEGLSIGLGAKFVYLDNFMALPLMAEASYAANLMDSLPAASFSASLLYAPSVLSFDDADSYFEFRAEAAMEVINSVAIYVGYRDIEVEYDYLPSETFNSSFYGGLKMSF